MNQAVTLTREALMLELNSRLHAVSQADCTACKFSKIRKLKLPDRLGANWDIGIIPLTCEGKPDDICLQRAREIARMAREQFLLED